LSNKNEVTRHIALNELGMQEERKLKERKKEKKKE
jgi:hypothetical protein